MADDEPKWRRRKEARPGEIVDGALEVFAEKGFAAAKLDDIARRAGISKPTLYLYFDTREEIFRAVARAAVASLLEARGSKAEGRDAPFAELAPQLLSRAAEMMEGGRSDRQNGDWRVAKFSRSSTHLARRCRRECDRDGHRDHRPRIGRRRSQCGRPPGHDSLPVTGGLCGRLATTIRGAIGPFIARANAG